MHHARCSMSQVLLLIVGRSEAIAIHESQVGRGAGPKAIVATTGPLEAIVSLLGGGDVQVDMFRSSSLSPTDIDSLYSECAVMGI